MTLAISLFSAVVSLLTASEIVAGGLFLTAVLTAVLVFPWRKLFHKSPSPGK